MKRPPVRRSTPGKPPPPRTINAPPRPVPRSGSATGSTPSRSTFTPPLIALRGQPPKPRRLTSGGPPPSGRPTPAPSGPALIAPERRTFRADIYLSTPDCIFVAISLQKKDGSPLGKVGILQLDRNHLTQFALSELRELMHVVSPPPDQLPGDPIPQKVLSGPPGKIVEIKRPTRDPKPSAPKSKPKFKFKKGRR